MQTRNPGSLMRAGVTLQDEWLVVRGHHPQLDGLVDPNESVVIECLVDEPHTAQADDGAEVAVRGELHGCEDAQHGADTVGEHRGEGPLPGDVVHPGRADHKEIAQRHHHDAERREEDEEANPRIVWRGRSGHRLDQRLVAVGEVVEIQRVGQEGRCGSDQEERTPEEPADRDGCRVERQGGDAKEQFANHGNSRRDSCKAGPHPFGQVTIL